MVTVQDLLLGDISIEYSILAGRSGLGKYVNAVSFIDTPTSLEWLRGNEIILTSAYLFSKDESALYDFIVTLINKNVSALGIKLGRYIHQLNKSVLDLADKYGFVIFSLPYGCVWSEVLQKFYRTLNDERENGYILNRDISVLVQNVNKIIGSVSQMQSTFLSFFSVDAVILDPNCSVQAKNFDIFDNTEGKLEKVLRHIQTMDGMLIEMPYQMAESENLWLSGLKLNNSVRIVFLTKGFFVPSQDLFRIRSIYEFVSKKPWMLEQADNSVKLLLESLPFAPKSSEIYHISRNLRFRNNNYFNIYILVGPDAMVACKFLKENIPQLAQSTLHRYHCEFVPVQTNSEEMIYIMLLSVNLQRLTQEEFDNRTMRYFHADELKELSFSTFCGAGVADISLLSECFEQAKKVRIYSKALQMKSCVLFYKDFQIMDLIIDKISIEEIAYINETLTTFDAIQTLEAYLEDLSVKSASEKLFVHENSLRYRLAKIRETFGYDFDNSFVRINLLLRIKVWRIRQQNKEWERFSSL